MNLANLLIDCGQHRCAVACLKRLTAFEPENASAWQNLAVACFLNRRFDEGLAACQQALKLDPRATTAMYNLALAYERQGDYARGRAWIRRAIAADPHDLSLQRLELRLRVLVVWSRIVAGVRRALHWLHLPS